MIDTLIALLLFAIVILTACLTLNRSLHATHQAQLATQALDRAADLIEALQAPTANAEVPALAAAAQQQLSRDLPAAARGAASDLIDLAVSLHGGPGP